MACSSTWVIQIVTLWLLALNKRGWSRRCIYCSFYFSLCVEQKEGGSGGWTSNVQEKEEDLWSSSCSCYGFHTISIATKTIFVWHQCNHNYWENEVYIPHGEHYIKRNPPPKKNSNPSSKKYVFNTLYMYFKMVSIKTITYPTKYKISELHWRKDKKKL